MWHYVACWGENADESKPVLISALHAVCECTQRLIRMVRHCSIEPCWSAGEITKCSCSCTCCQLLSQDWPKPNTHFYLLLQISFPGVPWSSSSPMSTWCPLQHLFINVSFPLLNVCPRQFIFFIISVPILLPDQFFSTTLHRQFCLANMLKIHRKLFT